MAERETYRTPDGDEHLVPEHECDDGWISHDPPKPCEVCKPHLRLHGGAS